MSCPTANRDYSTRIHSFLQDYVLMETANPKPPTPSFPTGPVLHRWLVGFYLSNLFSFIPSLSLLFISKTLMKWICWVGEKSTEMTFGLECLLPSILLIHYFLSLPNSMMILSDQIPTDSWLPTAYKSFLCWSNHLYSLGQSCQD